MISLALAVFFPIATPGPGFLFLAGMATDFGFRRAVPCLAQLLICNTLVLLLVAGGVAALVLTDPVTRTPLMMASLCYLLYLAGHIACAGFRIAIIGEKHCPDPVWRGYAATINPKAYAVNSVFITSFPIYPENCPAEVAVVAAVWLPLHLASAWFGATINQFVPPPRAVNIGLATSILLVVGLTTFVMVERP